jgi:importin subunit beta-1
VALQGIEFWSSLCNEEIAIKNHARLSDSTKFYVKSAMPHIIPILLERMAQQQEQDDKDEWNPHKAASVCLMLISNNCESDVIQHVVPFIKVKMLLMIRELQKMFQSYLKNSIYSNII